MEQEVETLLRKEAIEVVPPHDRESGFYSRYFIVPKKDGGLRPIIDLRRLNRSVMRLKFKMLTVKQVVSQIRSEDWFVTIDLKDTYFHVSILPQHRKGEAYQYRVLPFGLALSPRTFTKCVDTALVPLRLQGIRILNYIDDWLMLAECRSHAQENVGVKTKRQEKCGVGFDHDAGTQSSLQSRESKKAGHSLCVQRDTFWPAVHETPTVVAQNQGVLPEGKPASHDNTAVVYYINHQGGLRSRPLYKLAHQILVWSQEKLLSLRAVRMDASPRSGEADLESVRSSASGSLCYEGECSISSSSPGTGCHGTDVAEATSVRLSPDRFAPGSSGESSPGRGQFTVSSPVLARPSMVLGPDFSPRRLSMGDSCQEGSPLTGGGTSLHPRPELWKLWLIASGLSTEVVETILQKLYALKWKLFTSWCGERRQDPVNCPVGTVLEFLQARFSTGLSHSTLKVYVAAISAYHAPLGGLSVGKDPLAVVLEALSLTSLKRVGDLQAFSVAPSHLEFAPGMTKAFIYPRPGYVPKVPTNTPQPVVLQAFCPPPFRKPNQQKLNCMCPVRALDAYVHRAALWRKSDQLFVCYGPPKKGHPATKQSISRWIIDAISTAYESSDLPSPLGVKAHSTRAMAASKALMLGVPIQDICNAAGWSTPFTFV
ncbi:hypothetical protein M9458_032428, partial [Cirrhinus mrigala]